MKVVAVIPVKSTSSRIVSKNKKQLVDKPLYLHTLDKLLKINEIDEVWIDTDCHSMIELANDYGYGKYEKMKYMIRNKKYSNNNTDGNKLLENEINNIKSDIYLQILCTSPFTNIKTIKKSIQILKFGQNTSVVGVNKQKCYVWSDTGPMYNVHKIPNSNDLNDTIIETMSIYGITFDEFNRSKLRIGSNPYQLYLDGEEIIDINYEKEFMYAEKIRKSQILEEIQYLNMLKIKLNSCIIADILNDLGLEQYVLKSYKQNIKCNKLFGRIRPIQIRDKLPDEDTNRIYDCLTSYSSVSFGNIIFVNNLVKGKAYFGDLNTQLALSRGCQGTIVNGYTRDLDRITQLDYPIYYKNNTCADVKCHGVLDFYDKPIIVDGVKLYVNDLIFADKDGIVVIPKCKEQFILSECKKVISKESNIGNSISLGMDISEIMKQFGVF